MNLNQVTVPCYDIDKSRQFYQDMGFTLIVDTSHYLRFECPEGDSTFSLSLSDQKDQNSSSSTSIYFEFPAEALDDKVSSLASSGFIFTKLPRDEPWLWREASLLDPSGNKIILYHAGNNRKNPPWRVV